MRGSPGSLAITNQGERGRTVTLTSSRWKGTSCSQLHLNMLFDADIGSTWLSFSWGNLGYPVQITGRTKKSSVKGQTGHCSAPARKWGALLGHSQSPIKEKWSSWALRATVGGTINFAPWFDWPFKWTRILRITQFYILAGDKNIPVNTDDKLEKSKVIGPLWTKELVCWSCQWYPRYHRVHPTFFINFTAK